VHKPIRFRPGQQQPVEVEVRVDETAPAGDLNSVIASVILQRSREIVSKARRAAKEMVVDDKVEKRTR
jgi:hypothetical protein